MVGIACLCALNREFADCVKQPVGLGWPWPVGKCARGLSTLDTALFV